MMKQSGFPVVLKHVFHLRVYVGSAKENLPLHPVRNHHFGDGWSPSVSFLTFIHADSAQTSQTVYWKAVVLTFLSFPDCSPSCLRIPKATNEVYLEFMASGESNK